MKKSTMNAKLQIQSINYLHDPDAAQIWFELYLEIITDRLIQRSAKNNPLIHIDELSQLVEGDTI